MKESLLSRSWTYEIIFGWVAKTFYDETNPKTDLTDPHIWWNPFFAGHILSAVYNCTKAGNERAKISFLWKIFIISLKNLLMTFFKIEVGLVRVISAYVGLVLRYNWSTGRNVLGPRGNVRIPICIDRAFVSLILIFVDSREHDGLFNILKYHLG